jgi:hypothetical protein
LDAQNGVGDKMKQPRVSNLGDPAISFSGTSESFVVMVRCEAVDEVWFPPVFSGRARVAVLKPVNTLARLDTDTVQ